MRHLYPDDADYPSVLRQYRYSKTLPVISKMGNLEILQNKTIALFCSVKCPGNLILQTYDLAQTLRNASITVISGFHSPMEQECLILLLRGTQPIIHCPARGLEGMRLSTTWEEAISQNRLLLLSPFAGKLRRATANFAQQRNSFVTALADAVFIAYAASGSKTETFARQVLAWGKPLLTLESPDNSKLMALGAKPIQPDNITAIHLNLIP